MLELSMETIDNAIAYCRLRSVRPYNKLYLPVETQEFTLFCEDQTKRRAVAHAPVSHILFGHSAIKMLTGFSPINMNKNGLKSDKEFTFMFSKWFDVATPPDIYISYTRVCRTRIYIGHWRIFSLLMWVAFISISN